MKTLIGVLFVLLTILPSQALGQSRQFRHIKLSDGRELNTEILKTTDKGLLVRMPQGDLMVSFELLADLMPITQAEYEAQAASSAWVYSPGHEKELASILRQIPHLELLNDQSHMSGTISKLESCAADFACMSKVLDGRPWIWLITALPPTDNRDAQLVLRSRPSTGGLIQINEVRITENRAEMREMTLRAIHLLEQESTTTQKSHKGQTVSLGKALLPIPGYTWLARRRSPEFIASFAATTAGTGAVIYLMNSQETDPKLTAAAGCGTFFAFSVVTNLIGSQSKPKAVTISPTPRANGAIVQVNGRF